MSDAADGYGVGLFPLTEEGFTPGTTHPYVGYLCSGGLLLGLVYWVGLGILLWQRPLGQKNTRERAWNAVSAFTVVSMLVLYLTSPILLEMSWHRACYSEQNPEQAACSALGDRARARHTDPEQSCMHYLHGCMMLADNDGTSWVGRSCGDLFLNTCRSHAALVCSIEADTGRFGRCEEHQKTQGKRCTFFTEQCRQLMEEP